MRAFFFLQAVALLSPPAHRVRDICPKIVGNHHNPSLFTIIANIDGYVPMRPNAETS